MAGRFGDRRFTNLDRNAEEPWTEPGWIKRPGRTGPILSGLAFRARVDEAVVVCACCRSTAEADPADELHELHYWLSVHMRIAFRRQYGNDDLVTVDDDRGSTSDGRQVREPLDAAVGRQ